MFYNEIRCQAKHFSWRFNGLIQRFKYIFYGTSIAGIIIQRGLGVRVIPSNLLRSPRISFWKAFWKSLLQNRNVWHLQRGTKSHKCRIIDFLTTSSFSDRKISSTNKFHAELGEHNIFIKWLCFCELSQSKITRLSYSRCKATYFILNEILFKLYLTNYGITAYLCISNNIFILQSYFRNFIFKFQKYKNKSFILNNVKTLRFSYISTHISLH